MLRRSLGNFLIYLFIFGSTFSQTPYHQIIGGEVFSGIDIYGITQDDERVYWFTTNKGLYSFDGYEFHNYDHPDIKNSSFFNPTTDYQGNIYCNNLSGQIFKVSKGTMSLFHQVPDSILGSYMSFNFLPDNSLVVNSKSCYQVIDGQINSLLDSVESGFVSSGLMRQTNGSLIIHAKKNKFLSIGTDEILEVEIEADTETDYDLFSFYNHESGPMIGNKGLELLKVSDTVDQKILLEPIFRSTEQLSRIYLTTNAVWVASDRNGCTRIPFKKYGDWMDASERILFEDYFISYVGEDHEGNILLGTFGNGVIVIPNTQMTNLSVLDHLNASSICSNFSGGILIGTTKGEVYEWSSNVLTMLKKPGDKYVQVLKYSSEDDLLFVDQRNFYVYRKKDQRLLSNLSIGAVKDVDRIAHDQFAFATNNRVVVMQWDGNRFLQEYISNTGRTYSIVSVPDTKSLIVATSQGLKQVDEGRMSSLFFNGNPILVNDLIATRNAVLVATQKHGLLRLKNGELDPVNYINEQLLDQNVRQIAIRDHRIFLSTEGGFQIADTLAEKVVSISESDGLSIKKIHDFVVDQKSIWFLHQKGIQKVELDKFFNPKDFPTIDKLDVFNSADQKINDENSFQYFENNLKFSIHAPSLRNSEDLSYSYLLAPIATTWDSKNYQDNEIVYQSLPPDSYNFQIRLNFKGQTVDQASYSFTILAPFWQRWWFYVLSALTLIFLTYLFFRKRLLDQKRRADEINQLNESKLSALQSQMNPHFIFNALNSIQEYIIQNERKLAGKYLGKFADLMRIYLNYSQAKFISLQQEIEALNLYLELEKLRFEEVLSYEIQIDESIEMNEQIPSLLIQPYVENALKHGLLHKKVDRSLIVKMEKKSGDSLACTITDNGIGRKRSMEINKKRYPNHKSFATSATQNRLNLINYGIKKQIGVTTEDLYHVDGEPAGTKVELIIPLFDN